MTLWLGSVDKGNNTSKELTKGNSPPVVDRELTAPSFIVATVVMEKEFVFCQRSMLNTAYSVKAFEPRLNEMLGKGPYSLFCRYAIPSGYGMGEGK